MTSTITRYTCYHRYFLRRPFKGMNKEFYQGPFENEITDPYLKAEALRSLERAGAEEADRYDFSNGNVNPGPDDVGVVCLLGPHRLKKSHAEFASAHDKGDRAGIIVTAADVKDERLKGNKGFKVCPVS